LGGVGEDLPAPHVEFHPVENNVGVGIAGVTQIRLDQSSPTGDGHVHGLAVGDPHPGGSHHRGKLEPSGRVSRDGGEGHGVGAGVLARHVRDHIAVDVQVAQLAAGIDAGDEDVNLAVGIGTVIDELSGQLGAALERNKLGEGSGGR
jgi:hypothetical protein